LEKGQRRACQGIRKKKKTTKKKDDSSRNVREERTVRKSFLKGGGSEERIIDKRIRKKAGRGEKDYDPKLLPSERQTGKMKLRSNSAPWCKINGLVSGEGGRGGLLIKKKSKPLAPATTIN